MLLRVTLVMAVLLGLAGYGAVRLAAEFDPVTDDRMAPTFTFEIQPGDALGRITERLETAGMIRNAQVTNLLARWQKQAGRLHVGEYEVSPSMSPNQILEVITTGKVKLHSVTVPEGLRASEVAMRLERAGLAEAEAFLEVVHDAAFAQSLGINEPTLEGYLYPDTYRMAKGLPPADVARAFIGQFKRVWIEIEPLAAERGLDMHQVVTLASIVEKETGVPVERPLIAAVFLNRLDLGMRLETDPTVIYGIPDFDGNLKKRHLLDESNPYNTYKIRGLPPGPIANPGADALRAVVMPTETDYLYFVSRNDGSHFFSATYREHEQAVDEFQRKRRRSK